jgi:transglutaminase-like putative cysteine protease
MRTGAAWCLSVLLLVSSARASEPDGKLVQDTWNAAYLEGVRCGYARTSVREIDRDGHKILRTVMELKLTVQRFQDTVTLRMETGTEETPEGKVIGVSMKQFLGANQSLDSVGMVKEGKLHLKVKGAANIDRLEPWNDKVLGLYRQETFYKDHQVKPGDVLHYASYEPTLMSVITAQVSVKDYEEVEFLKKKTRLLRVETQPDKIETKETSLQLPPLITWLDQNLQPVRSQAELPGLGTMVLYRATEAFARQRPERGGPNIGLNSLIRLKQRIEQPYDTTAAIYRVTLKDDTKPATAFVQDQRQKVLNVEGNSFELHVQASRGPQQVDKPKPAPEEFLKSCFFIKCDDPLVREHTRKAVGMETDPWQKALRIEQYVYKHVDKKNFTVAFATADQVAKDMEGDCTEHSMLAAAMCRATGIPSRTAIGLIYFDHAKQGPVMAFHMWTEVWIKGEWLPIDPTWGRGYVGATHLKITDHSWYNTQSLTPLMPVLRVLGKLSIEVVRVEGPS